MDQAAYFKDNDKAELVSMLSDLDNVVAKLPRELNDFQKENYSFAKSAEKILKVLEE